jgi:excisionase family DNA binding protein
VVEEQGRLLVRIMEAADLLSLSRTSIYNLIGDGSLEIVHMGKAVRVTMKSIRCWVEKQTAKTSEDR